MSAQAARPNPDAPEPSPAAIGGPLQVVLTGNPNCGKTTLFNALTGLRAKVGNYAGVTVERKEGRMRETPPGLVINLLDLPGTYSLAPQSLDEQIARDVLFGRLPEVPPPQLVVVVIDASNLERNLYYATQVLELGYPSLIALNMVDVAAENGHDIDASALAQALGVPVLPLVASRGEGVAGLRAALVEFARHPVPARAFEPPGALAPALRCEVEQLAARLGPEEAGRNGSRRAEALLLLTDDRSRRRAPLESPARLDEAIEGARRRLEQGGIDWRSSAIETRYGWASAIHERVVTERLVAGTTLSDRIDRVVTHRVWGVGIFGVIMALMFQSIFTFAEGPMGVIESVVDTVGHGVSRLVPPGELNSLLVDGALAGAGAVVVFLPQILLLFLFIGLLEDTGYMARAAFLMDRLMSRVGLHGKSFIPLLSSFACAIPGIMATRTIESPKDRLTTILVAPLMSCSARLPVYTLLIAACVPDRRLFGLVGLQGLTLLAMYLLGIVVALLLAWLFKKTLLKGEPPLLIMELPPYRRPALRVVMRHMWERSRLFLQRAGTVILGASILLWFLSTYPRDRNVERKYEQLRAAVRQTAAKHPPSSAAVHASLREQLQDLDRAQAGERLRGSFSGLLGRAIEPVIAPLGLDWQVGIGIIASFAAREVFVSTMSTVYNVGAGHAETDSRALMETLRAQRRPNGQPVYTPRTALTLMVFYVFALQCVSTVAVVRRETNGWKWPLFQWAYMGLLAWAFAFATYHGLRLLGYD